jgi:hypothetical protein
MTNSAGRFPFNLQNGNVGLELLECKTFKNGCVLVTYRVRH